MREYLLFNYIENEVDKAQVSIFFGNRNDVTKLKVTNIVPTIKAELKISEYNKVLHKFYEDVIRPYKADNYYIQISELTSYEFNPLTFISSNALAKLKTFNVNANKSIGASHPCDKERWFEFICQQ